MRTVSVITLLAALTFPTIVFAEVQTFTTAHTYILGDHDSKDDARQRCLLEAKRKILEQAGIYIESASEVKNFDLAKDKITSFAAAVMQVKDTKENFGFENGHMSLTVKLTAQVDLAEVRKQLAARQLDAGVREDVSVQKERLKRLEAQLEAMQQQGGQSSVRTPSSPPIDISSEELQILRTRATQGDAKAQTNLGQMYDWGEGVPQNYAQARHWWERAAAQGNATAQYFLGVQYGLGRGVPQDYVQERQWYEQAATQGHASAQFLLGSMYAHYRGVPKDYAKAAQWYGQAATQGHARAQFALGELYHKGEGVPRDYGKARHWYEQAAVQGNAQAQLHLGILYANGQGVSQDDVRAYMWSILAVVHSTDDNQMSVVNYRDNIARRMVPEQIAEAQRLSQQCQVRQFKGC